MLHRRFLGWPRLSSIRCYTERPAMQGLGSVLPLRNLQNVGVKTRNTDEEFTGVVRCRTADSLGDRACLQSDVILRDRLYRAWGRFCGYWTFRTLAWKSQMLLRDWLVFTALKFWLLVYFSKNTFIVLFTMLILLLGWFVFCKLCLKRCIHEKLWYLRGYVLF